MLRTYKKMETDISTDRSVLSEFAKCTVLCCRNGRYICAGSDDGSFYIWDRKSTNIVRTIKGDDCIVNCLQPHPHFCLLATSGVDKVVRLWSPLPVSMLRCNSQRCDLA